MLTLYNTLTRQKERFEPIEPGKVGLYVCGITVYDLCHVGHARMMVVFDVLYRHLRASGLDVTYVRNITDVDDKIIARANELGEAMGQVTERYIAEMDQDAAALGVLKPDREPRATETIPEMIDMIIALIERKHAYAADNGDVYYSVTSFAEYGKLSGRKLDELRAGERVEVDKYKRDPLDFVLWKAAKPGEPGWDSPWGEGRPGWHIECSAMSRSLLGETFDIHGGGMDLQFPHHENEIAQSEALSCKPFANYWVHNGFVRIDNEKMSKSLGNFFTVRDVLTAYSGEEIRLFILNSHYRSPLNYSTAQLDSARASLQRLYTALRDAPAAARADASPDDELPAAVAEARARFAQAMDDDLNTTEAVSVLFELASLLNQSGDAMAMARAAFHALLELGDQLGLLQQDPKSALQGGNTAGLDTDAIEALIQDRLAARAAKDWARSDDIRDQLSAQGVVLEDRDGTTTWRRG